MEETKGGVAVVAWLLQVEEEEEEGDFEGVGRSTLPKSLLSILVPAVPTAAELEANLCVCMWDEKG